MPQESQLAHRRVSSPNLPYRTNVSPTETDPYYAQGSGDILTSMNTYAERRPGFADAVEGTPTTFNNLQRLFTWDRTDNTFYVMACDINASGQAVVYQMPSGGTSFSAIFTDTGSATPFDFVVSNNTLYFSNGHLAKKWDPVNGVSNWGIAAGSVSSSTAAYAGTGADAGGGSPWTNPTNIQGAPDTNYATRTLTAAAGTVVFSNYIDATNYGFAVTSTNTVTGIQVVITGLQSLQQTVTYPREAINIWLLFNGSPIGVFKSAVLPTSAGTVTLGGNSDLWGTTGFGTTITPSMVNAASFGIQIQAVVNRQFLGSGATCTFSLDAAQITVFNSGGPPVSVSGAAGTMTATAGYTYVFCYGNSNTGHISSPSLPSASTGVFTNKASVSVTVTASTDPQVNQIRLFRTTDGGGGIYFELPTSPYPNTSGALTDSAPDANLQVISVAPTATFNDPPTPFQNPVYFSGRIWGFTGTRVYFSGLEEINQGVPEESFPSGAAGNFWAFDEPVQGLAVGGTGNAQTLAIWCGGRIYGITGNSLDTFRRFQVSNRRGCRNLTAISALGGMVAWLDSSTQVWASDGNSLNELSGDVRPDFATLTPSTCSMAFHVAGRFHWLVFSTGTKIYVYDMDTNQWMPPWTFAATYIFSGETSPGNYVLMASNGTKALQLNTTKFNDNGATYQPIMKTNLMSLVPDYGRRFSYMAAGVYDEPSRTGVPWTFQVTNNNQTISDFQFLADDDPKLGTYTSIVANLVDTAVAYNRTNGTNMTQKVYTTTSPAARWISVLVKLANADQVDNIYEIFMAYKSLGGR